MFTRDISRILRRFCILLVLLAGLGVMASTAPTGSSAAAPALQCCTQCEPDLQECYVRRCHCSATTGLCPPGSQSCLSQCNFYFDYCEIHCDSGC